MDHRPRPLRGAREQKENGSGIRPAAPRSSRPTPIRSGSRAAASSASPSACEGRRARASARSCPTLPTASASKSSRSVPPTCGFPISDVLPKSITHRVRVRAEDWPHLRICRGDAGRPAPLLDQPQVIMHFQAHRERTTVRLNAHVCSRNARRAFSCVSIMASAPSGGPDAAENPVRLHLLRQPVCSGSGEGAELRHLLREIEPCSSTCRRTSSSCRTDAIRPPRTSLRSPSRRPAASDRRNACVETRPAPRRRRTANRIPALPRTAAGRIPPQDAPDRATLREWTHPSSPASSSPSSAL